ncbi:hypothetical protein MFLO_08642 [Listeria floridensis FSL S10-1187]|uniref:PRD domain-containing protein n=1 Tax=Listeria floridensis FSL S10-1187 TaxID=1265817 RepID=A0ABN0RF08_9LIST|nr:PRD domain-containing protein [Listeria floridensis]EUJ31666.1 hypothetical protein MFLO_08642 [Listeria floridensis FSL S10-1187]
MVLLFEKLIGLEFREKAALTKHIQTYIKVLFYRRKFQMALPAYSLQSVNQQFQKVFQLTEKVIQLLEQDKLFKTYFKSKFKNEELAHLAVFF